MRKGTLKVKKSKASGSETEENDFDALKGNGVADVDDNASSTGEANGDAHSDDETESKSKKSKPGKPGKDKAEDGDDEKDDEDSGDDFDKLTKSKTSKGKRKSSGKDEGSSKRTKVASKVTSDDEVDEDKEKAKAESEDDEDDKEERQKTTTKKTSSKKRKSVKAAKSKKEKRSVQKKDVTPDVSETEEEYEVDKVVDMKESRGQREFKIRWKGYTAASDTWEAEKSLSCPEAIKAYLDANPPKEEEEKKAKGGKGKKGKSPKKAPKVKKSESGGEESEDQQEYEVEKVLEVHNKRDGTHEFLIRWKGFSKKDDTWEPEAHLNCRDLIDTFMQRVEKAKSVSGKELRTAPAHTERFTLSMQDKDRRLSKRGAGKQRATYHDFD